MMTGTLLLVGLWLPLIWSYGYARWRGLPGPVGFAFFAGCAALGLPLLLSTSTFLLAEALLGSWPAQLCLQSSLGCALYEAVNEWAAVLLFLVCSLAGPPVAARYLRRS